jgi:hypothetical protein
MDDLGYTVASWIFDGDAEFQRVDRMVRRRGMSLSRR